MLLPPCFPSVSDSKNGEVEIPPHSDDAICENSLLAQAIHAVNSMASAIAGTVKLDQTFCLPPLPF